MSYKKRQYRLKKRVAKILAQVGYDVIFPENDNLFDVVAIEVDRIRYIAVMSEEPSKEVVKKYKAINKPGDVEIWYRDGKGCLKTIYP
jgi:predicted transcriptional regulator